LLGTIASMRSARTFLHELGNDDEARFYYRRAARRTLSLPEQRYLLAHGSGGQSGGS
jgi:hypothetical protein